MDDILQKLTSIEEKLAKLEQESQRMTRHITFIEMIYESVQTPLFYIINKFSTKPIEKVPLLLDNI